MSGAERAAERRKRLAEAKAMREMKPADGPLIDRERKDAAWFGFWTDHERDELATDEEPNYG